MRGGMGRYTQRAKEIAEAPRRFPDDGSAGRRRAGPCAARAGWVGGLESTASDISPASVTLYRSRSRATSNLAAFKVFRCWSRREQAPTLTSCRMWFTFGPAEKLEHFLLESQRGSFVQCSIMRDVIFISWLQ